MIKHVLIVILLITVFNAARAQSAKDSTATHLPETDTLVKHPHKIASKVKHASKPKTDSVIVKKGTSVKSTGKTGNKAKYIGKTDSTAAKTDTTVKLLHKTKNPAKHQHKTDTVAHAIKADTTLKHAAKADTAAKVSPVSTLSYAQYDAYTKGDDINEFSQLAESNHYPMPDKVLKVARQVGLTTLQTSKITEIEGNLERKKKEMGVFIIRNEGVLDSLFRKHKLDDGLLIFYTNRSGLYYGELRNAILQACLATEKLLTQLQIKRFEAAVQPK